MQVWTPPRQCRYCHCFYSSVHSTKCSLLHQTTRRQMQLLSTTPFGSWLLTWMMNIPSGSMALSKAQHITGLHQRTLICSSDECPKPAGIWKPWRHQAPWGCAQWSWTACGWWPLLFTKFTVQIHACSGTFLRMNFLIYFTLKCTFLRKITCLRLMDKV